MNRTDITTKIKNMLVETLNLNMSPAEILEDEPLFRSAETGPEGGLSLDSLEALEIVLGLERTFGFKIRDVDYQQAFRSVQSLATFVEQTLNDGQCAQGQ